jgi:hypothetical protein
MELDGLANPALDFLDGCPGCNTSREIRPIAAKFPRLHAEIRRAIRYRPCNYRAEQA